MKTWISGFFWKIRSDSSGPTAPHSKLKAAGSHPHQLGAMCSCAPGPSPALMTCGSLPPLPALVLLPESKWQIPPWLR